MNRTALIEEISRMPLSEVYKIEMYARRLRLAGSVGATPRNGDRIRSRKRFHIDENSTELIRRFRE